MLRPPYKISPWDEKLLHYNEIYISDLAYIEIKFPISENKEPGPKIPTKIG